MKMLPQVLFWLGLISVPFAWLVWYFGPEIEIIRPVLANINDPALRAALLKNWRRPSLNAWRMRTRKDFPAKI